MKAYGAQVIFYLVLRVDQLLVRGYAGYRQLGLYALATTVAELLWLLTDPLAAALVPHQVRAPPARATGSASRWHDGACGYRWSRRSARGCWHHSRSASCTAPGSPAPYRRCACCYQVWLPSPRRGRCGAMLLKQGRAVVLSVLGFGALCLNVALNVALLPRIGIQGSSIASSLCYAALALSYVVLARRQARQEAGEVARSGWPSWSAP